VAAFVKTCSKGSRLVEVRAVCPDRIGRRTPCRRGECESRGTCLIHEQWTASCRRGRMISQATQVDKATIRPAESMATEAIANPRRGSAVLILSFPTSGVVTVVHPGLVLIACRCHRCPGVLTLLTGSVRCLRNSACQAEMGKFCSKVVPLG